MSVRTTPKKNKRTMIPLAQPRSNRDRKSICSVLDALHLRQFVVIIVDLHSFLSTYQSTARAPHDHHPAWRVLVEQGVTLDFVLFSQ